VVVLLQASLVSTAADASFVLLQYPQRLEVWRLGSTAQTTG